MNHSFELIAGWMHQGEPPTEVTSIKTSRRAGTARATDDVRHATDSNSVLNEWKNVLGFPYNPVATQVPAQPEEAP